MDSFPILKSLIETGDIKVIDSEYVGIASDDVEVHIGTVGRESLAENYLKDFSTPDRW